MEMTQKPAGSNACGFFVQFCKKEQKLLRVISAKLQKVKRPQKCGKFE